MLDIIVDDLRSNALKFVHGVLLMLRLDSDSTVLNHEAKMVESDPDDKNRNVVADGAGFKQIYGEEERVIVVTLM